MAKNNNWYNHHDVLKWLKANYSDEIPWWVEAYLKTGQVQWAHPKKQGKTKLHEQLEVYQELEDIKIEEQANPVIAYSLQKAEYYQELQAKWQDMKLQAKAIDTQKLAPGAFVIGDGGPTGYFFSTNHASDFGHNPEFQQIVQHPLSSKRKDTIYAIIIELNDNHKWSREKIADWLDSLPNQPKFYPKIESDDTPKPKSKSTSPMNAECVDCGVAIAYAVAVGYMECFHKDTPDEKSYRCKPCGDKWVKAQKTKQTKKSISDHLQLPPISAVPYHFVNLKPHHIVQDSIVYSLGENTDEGNSGCECHFEVQALANVCCQCGKFGHLCTDFTKCFAQ